ncbi:hypothetical protein [Burkholderia thailandensis]|uniref:hypothetical protein n=1 Tax=Burkholderia thailandensis TaxID=57975 RepID=UPI00016A6E93|nr:hypothetical protein [Burkholderia thailandensis]AHI76721.1 hypothetical protein BTQ_3596 [Burkholderia thailandensis 2002721723]AHI81041.1 hypothetical protein BTJ_4632 [Burkholderia thailandensis E444]AIC90744.1 hypothetical protein BTRA_5358 [Burkholderia thailandensis USAMRU Malaysia \
MPVIHILHRHTGDGVSSLLQQICEAVCAATDIPLDKVWAFWHPVDPALAWRADWYREPRGGPVVRIFCRRSHSAARVQGIVAAVRSTLAAALGCGFSTVFVQVIRVEDEEVFSVG